jgi:hypothetical protein
MKYLRSARLAFTFSHFPLTSTWCLEPMNNPYLPSSPASSSTSAFQNFPSSSKQPITRSRTLFYLSIRDSSTTSYSRGPRRGTAQYGDTVDVADDEQEGLIGGRDGSIRVGVKGLPPKWLVCLGGWAVVELMGEGWI